MYEDCGVEPFGAECIAGGAGAGAAVAADAQGSRGAVIDRMQLRQKLYAEKAMAFVCGNNTFADAQPNAAGDVEEIE